MPELDPRSLLREAVRASRRAVAPYSKFRVGAALLTRDGTVIHGANVESVSYGLTCCAERIALFKALTEGHADFTAIATTPETSIEILKSREFEMTQGIGTIFGTVYFEGETLSLWFGRKYNQLPALARESTAAALRKLFEIVDNSERNGKA